jgi:hypothetical protein
VRIWTQVGILFPFDAQHLALCQGLHKYSLDVSKFIGSEEALAPATLVKSPLPGSSLRGVLCEILISTITSQGGQCHPLYRQGSWESVAQLHRQKTRAGFPV